MQNTKNLIWLDLEMTGLIPERETILEAAIIITDADLNILTESESFAIFHTEQQLNSMSEWCIKQHGISGLTKRASKSPYRVSDVEEKLLQIITLYTYKNTAPLCGNSISQDRLFLRKYMPSLTDYLHYRNVDVSSFREMINRWYPNTKPYKKQHKHTALEDIKESIQELAYYKSLFFTK